MTTAQKVSTAPRTPLQIREHYEIEKELAARLRHSSKEQRKALYSSLYDEMFRRVPHHPQITRKSSPEDTERAVSLKLGFLRSFLSRDSIFMEVGPGDCALSLAVTTFVKQVYAIDVSDEITKSLETPDNFELIISDGCSIPLPRNSVNVAYSNQLMEHLHEDDAIEQLRNIYGALAPRGRYICITPNRLSGPHDVSRHFDAVATGFHLKEYSVAELSSLFRRVGFSQIRLYIGAKGRYVAFPTSIMTMIEVFVERLPQSFRRFCSRNRVARAFLGFQLVGIK